MEKIVFGPKKLPGFVCGPKGKPGILVIQEWWGVTDIIKSHAERLAQQGYRTLIPDVYNGKIGVSKEEASHLMGNLDWPVAVDQLCDAVAYLKEEGSPKVGAVGFCMGGALSLAAGQHCGINAAASFYGTPAKELCQPENVKIPVELHGGEFDESKGFSDKDTMAAWADVCSSAGGQAKFYLYEECGHAFLNSGDEAVAKRKLMGFPEPSQEVQDRAWSRLYEFFGAHLM